MYYTVLVCTTKYYSVLQSTTPYYKVLLQYYPVLQSTTTYYSSTTFYSSTTLYYKVLHSTTLYYSVLHSTTLYYKVLLRTTQYYSVLPCTTKSITLYYKAHMKRPVQCAEQQVSSSNFTKYCACHARWSSWLIRITNEMPSTMRKATGVIPQLHQILRLPRKTKLMIDPRHIWDVICIASADMIRPWDRHLAPAASETLLVPSRRRILYGKIQRFALRLSSKFHEVLCLPQRWHSTFTKYCACHATWTSWLIRVTYETSLAMRGASKVTLDPHQILRLPRNSEFKIWAKNPWIASANIKTIRR